MLITYLHISAANVIGQRLNRRDNLTQMTQVSRARRREFPRKKEKGSTKKKMTI
jgi:hypothetical protein